MQKLHQYRAALAAKIDSDTIELRIVDKLISMLDTETVAQATIEKALDAAKTNGHAPVPFKAPVAAPAMKVSEVIMAEMRAVKKPIHYKELANRTGRNLNSVVGALHQLKARSKVRTPSPGIWQLAAH